MDNIAHTLAGFALQRAGLGRSTRLATTALVLGSNLPDIDGVAFLGGRLVYIDVHRGITHSFAGGIVLAAAFGITLYALDRWVLTRRVPRGRFDRRLRPEKNQGTRFDRWVRSRLPDAEHTGPGPLVVLSIVAVLVHLGFDFLNDYGIRLLLPFSSRWYYGDIIFITDPWFWLLLGGGLHLSAKRGVLAELLTWAGWALLSLPVMLVSLVSMPARFVWVVGLAALAFLRWRTTGASTAPARVALVLLGLYCLCVSGLHALATHNAAKEIRSRGAGGDVHRLALIPIPANPFRWNMLYESRGEIIAGKVPVWSRGAPALPTQRFKMNLDRPEVQQALRTREGQTAFRFCRYLFAHLNQTPLGPTVTLRDARFTVRDTHEFSTFVIPVKQDSRQGANVAPIAPGLFDNAISSEIPPHRGDVPHANR